MVVSDEAYKIHACHAEAASLFGGNDIGTSGTVLQKFRITKRVSLVKLFDDLPMGNTLHPTLPDDVKGPWIFGILHNALPFFKLAHSSDVAEADDGCELPAGAQGQ